MSDFFAARTFILLAVVIAGITELLDGKSHQVSIVFLLAGIGYAILAVGANLRIDMRDVRSTGDPISEDSITKMQP